MTLTEEERLATDRIERLIEELESSLNQMKESQDQGSAEPLAIAEEDVTNALGIYPLDTRMQPDLKITTPGITYASTVSML